MMHLSWKPTPGWILGPVRTAWLLLVCGMPLLPVQAPRIPEDPPRLQWREEGGYCGEASIQTMALRFGLWVSQAEVRRLAGGEVLLGRNAALALERLKLRFETWEPGNGVPPRLPAFLGWMEGHLRAGHPCMAGVYLAGGKHRDYDHIVPVLGIRPFPTKSSAVDGRDWILFHSLVERRPIWKRVQDLGASRTGCVQGIQEAGNLPMETLYGLALLGPAPGHDPLLHVRLDVDRAEEPNPHEGQAPCGLTGTLTLSGLKAGARYVILRRDRGRKGLGPYATCHVFTAQGASMTWTDPHPIPSDAITQYRCIPSGQPS